jgi:hypothetical protein
MSAPPLEADLIADCKRAAAAMGCYVEWLGQHRADKAGQSRGAPDGLLYCAGHLIPLEFKRARNPDGTPAGRLSLDQIVARDRRREQHVETYIVDSLESFITVVNGCRRPARQTPITTAPAAARP